MKSSKRLFFGALLFSMALVPCYASSPAMLPAQPGVHHDLPNIDQPTLSPVSPVVWNDPVLQAPACLHPSAQPIHVVLYKPQPAQPGVHHDLPNIDQPTLSPTKPGIPGTPAVQPALAADPIAPAYDLAPAPAVVWSVNPTLPTQPNASAHIG